ncbi:MAG: T9SS type A sorting domain-containing protein [Bacteroidota bacterium]
MKSIFTLILSILVLQVSSQLVNHIDDHYGFEDGPGSFFKQPATGFWAITDDKAASGSYSFKYSSENALDVILKATGDNVNLEPATYELRFKIWISEGSQISGLRFIVRAPFKNNEIPISESLPRETWVEITQAIELNEGAVESGLMLRLDPNHNVQGVIYFDDFGMWGDSSLNEGGDDGSDDGGDDGSDDGGDDGGDDDGGDGGNEETNKVPRLATIVREDVSLDPGIYNLKLHVKKTTETTITKFYSSIDEPWSQQEWDLQGLENDSWTLVSKELVLSEPMENSSFSIFVDNTQAGIGAFYVDDIQFVLKSATQATGLVLNRTELELAIEEKFELSYATEPVGAIYGALSWNSSNTDVATVNDQGVVTARSIGSSIITLSILDGAVSSQCEVKVVSNVLGASDSYSGVQVWPNPFENDLAITVGDARLQSVSIYDLSGGLIFQTNDSGDGKFLSLSPSLAEVPTGIYMISIQTSTGIVRTKVIRH